MEKLDRMQEIRQAETKLGRARTTLCQREQRLEELESDLMRVLASGDVERAVKLRRDCARKRRDIQMSEGRVASAEEVIYADDWAPKNPLSNDAQMRIRRGW